MTQGLGFKCTCCTYFNMISIFILDSATIVAIEALYVLSHHYLFVNTIESYGSNIINLKIYICGACTQISIR